MEFDFGKRRRKKVKPAKSTELEQEEQKNNVPYTYEFLLKRFYEKWKEEGGSINTNEKLVLDVPKIDRSSRKTVWINFSRTIKKINRQADQAMYYVLAELSCSGTIDNVGRLILVGRYFPKDLEKILKKYVDEYLRCRICKSANTFLVKENRLNFLKCDSCQSKYSVLITRQINKPNTNIRVV